MRLISRTNAGKILGLFLVIVFGFTVFLARIFDVASSNRYAGEPVKKEIDTGLRGEIITNDGYHIAISKKTFAVSVTPSAIDPSKRELFLNFFSIYSGMSTQDVAKLLDSNETKITMIKELSGREAKYYKQLSAALDKMKVFVPYKVGNRVFRRGLEIEENNFLRFYPYGDSLQPILGFVKPETMAGLTGIEKFKEENLNNSIDGKVIGTKDVSGNIIFSKSTVDSIRTDGENVNLSINFKLQKQIEGALDIAQQKLNSDSILAGVMDPKTGSFIALASSKRYIPYNITPDKVSNMKADSAQYIYEPGSTIKPILFAIAMEQGKINQFETINGFGGKFQVDKKIITDEHKMWAVPAEDIIVFSSNVGMAQLGIRMSPKEIFYGLKKFGFSQKTNTGIAYELQGDVPTIAQLNSNLYRAVVSYGYSLRVNFLQLMAAYNVFTNDGILIKPTLFQTPRDQNESAQIISSATASKMRSILIKTVMKGTGVPAQVPGLEVGGKTGTAHIAKNGKYVGAFNSSFFGYVSDGKHSYTVGVLVIEPKHGHFGAETAAPVFKSIVLNLINDGYLKPLDVNTSQQTIKN